MLSLLLSVCLFYLLDLAEAGNYCPDGTYCCYGCCNYNGFYDCCDYSVVYAWWFWFVWSLFFLMIVISCACAMRRRRTANQHRNVVIVRSYPGYGATTAGAEVPQYPYNQYPQGYPQGYYNQGYTVMRPQGYAQPPGYSVQPPPESEQNKPPPYNPTVDTPASASATPSGNQNQNQTQNQSQS